MTVIPRDAGCATVNLENLNCGDHACVVYESEHERRATTRRYIENGLKAQQKVVYVGADIDEGRCDWLERDNRLFAAALRCEQLVVTAMDVAYQTTNFDAGAVLEQFSGMIGDAHKEGFSGCRIAGVMDWATGVGPDALIEYETGTDQILSSLGATGLCQFNRQRFSADLLLRIEGCHPLVFSDRLGSAFGDLVIEPGPTGELILRGEIDSSNHESLRHSLRAWAKRRGDLRLDLSRLSFVDVAGAWEIQAISEELRASGKDVTIIEGQPFLTRLLSFVEPAGEHLH